MKLIKKIVGLNYSPEKIYQNILFALVVLLLASACFPTMTKETEWDGIINMKNKKWADDFSPLDPKGTSFVDHTYTKAYLRHLFVAGEIFAGQIASEHNLAFYLDLVREARKHIKAGDFKAWKDETVKRITTRL